MPGCRLPIRQSEIGNRKSYYTRVAQPVERATVNRVVGGSSPSAGADRSRLANRFRRSPPQGEDAGLNPAESSEESSNADFRLPNEIAGLLHSAIGNRKSAMYSLPSSNGQDARLSSGE